MSPFHPTPAPSDARPTVRGVVEAVRPNETSRPGYSAKIRVPVCPFCAKPHIHWHPSAQRVMSRRSHCDDPQLRADYDIELTAEGYERLVAQFATLTAALGLPDA